MTRVKHEPLCSLRRQKHRLKWERISSFKRTWDHEWKTMFSSSQHRVKMWCEGEVVPQKCRVNTATSNMAVGGGMNTNTDVTLFQCQFFLNSKNQCSAWYRNVCVSNIFLFVVIVRVAPWWGGEVTAFITWGKSLCTFMINSWILTGGDNTLNMMDWSYMSLTGKITCQPSQMLSRISPQSKNTSQRQEIYLTLTLFLWNDLFTSL